MVILEISRGYFVIIEKLSPKRRILLFVVSNLYILLGHTPNKKSLHGSIRNLKILNYRSCKGSFLWL